jgi:Nucleotide modification associated domain 2
MNNTYFYKLTADNGGAPCVRYGLLSLAICKPMIRKTAKEGDLIFGLPPAVATARHSAHPQKPPATTSGGRHGDGRIRICRRSAWRRRRAGGGRPPDRVRKARRDRGDSYSHSPDSRREPRR